MSLSARRAWIEIVKLFRQNYECFVALRKESVDRNRASSIIWGLRAKVALRKESVDRNYAQAQLVNGVQVALRKESVDRNSINPPSSPFSTVALRKESVDRNLYAPLCYFMLW